MDLIYIRPIKKDDHEEIAMFGHWLYENRDKNNFDPEPFLREQAEIYVAYNKTGILYFFSIFRPILWGSLAPKPGISPTDAVRCMRTFQQEIVSKCAKENIGEVFFHASEETVPEISADYGWKPANNMYSLNVNKLEPSS